MAPPSSRWRSLSPPIFLLFLSASAVAVVQLVRAALHEPFIGICLTAAMALTLGAAFLRWVLLLSVTDPARRTPAPGLRVAVVTSFVPGYESIPMLAQTLEAMAGLQYPHDTWVLDEGDEPAVVALCAQLGVRHFSRKDNPEHHQSSGPFQSATKHGNYNAWLNEIGFWNYDVLAALDPDQIPEPEFLTRTLGYFRDPRVGYVVSPQTYYNQRASVVAGGSDEESRDFYWITQRAYNRLGSPSVIGAHNVHRMTALRAVGGLAPHVADDVLITLLYQLNGWSGVYVPQVLARGLSPVDWGTYLKQQRRWARSLLDVKYRVYPTLLKRMSRRTRLVGLLQGLSYLQDGLTAILLLMALITSLAAGISEPFLSQLLDLTFLSSVGVLFLTGLYTHVYHGPSGNITLYWRAALLRFVKWPFTLLAVYDVLRNRDHGYELTVKVPLPGSGRGLLLWPHLLVCFALGIAFSAGVHWQAKNSFLARLLAVAYAIAWALLTLDVLRSRAARLSADALPSSKS